MVHCKSSFFWICSTAVLAGWVLTLCPETHWTTSSETSSNHSCNWTCMIFTIQWPGSFCLSLENRNICRIPENIHNWTIHGLWPTRVQGCCYCWPVFQSHLQDLEPELAQLWPSFIKSKSNFSFWKDEWFKHGTCAACVESMGSPAHYFRTSLKLRTLFDVDNALANTGIKPSCNISYKHEEIHAALGPFLGNNYVVQCVKDKKEREVWVQLKIFVSKNITLGCQKEETLKISRASNTSLGHPCPKNTTIFYFPIDHEHPKQPCT